MSRREEAFQNIENKQNDQQFHEVHEEGNEKNGKESGLDLMEMVRLFQDVVKTLKNGLNEIGFEEEDHQVELIQTFFDSWV